MGIFSRKRDVSPSHPVQHVDVNTVRYSSGLRSFAMPTGYTKPDAARYTSDKLAMSEYDVWTKAPQLVDLYKKARTVTSVHNLDGLRAAVYLVVDRSASMMDFFQFGDVQRLADRILAMSALFDDDGIVPVTMFGSDVHPTAHVQLDSSAHQVRDLHDALGGAGTMGSTNYVAAMESVITHYAQTNPGVPALVIFQTDGEPNNASDTELLIRASAKMPIFWQFVGFGGSRFDFLHRLDHLEVPRLRVVDNTGFFSAGENPSDMEDQTLYFNMLDGFRQWMTDARDANIIG